MNMKTTALAGIAFIALLAAPAAAAPQDAKAQRGCQQPGCQALAAAPRGIAVAAMKKPSQRALRACAHLTRGSKAWVTCIMMNG